MNTSSLQCPFCIADAEPFLHNDFGYVRCDKNPVSPGHLLVIPYEHVANYFEISPKSRNALFELLDQAKQYLDENFAPQGYNIGINIGEASGQTVPHVHVHLIPRYTGDMENPRGGVRGVIPGKQSY